MLEGSQSPGLQLRGLVSESNQASMAPGLSLKEESVTLPGGSNGKNLPTMKRSRLT